MVRDSGPMALNGMSHVRYNRSFHLPLGQSVINSRRYFNGRADSAADREPLEDTATGLGRTYSDTNSVDVHMAGARRSTIGGKQASERDVRSRQE